MPRLCNQARWAVEAYARSACSLPRRLRARPASPFTARIGSTKGMRKRESCTCAPEICAAHRSARSSTSKWCLLSSTNTDAILVFARSLRTSATQSRRSYPHWLWTSYSPRDSSARRASPWSIVGLQFTGTITICSTFNRRLPSAVRSISMRSPIRRIDSTPR